MANSRSPASSEALLSIEHLTKRFPQVLANDDISFEVRRGEICCLLGENGAGKSTLAEMLYGASEPDAGRIRFDGRPAAFASPRDAIDVGIGMVHQHFALIPTLTAVENVFIGTRSGGLLLDLNQTRRRLEELRDSYQIELDLGVPVSELSVGQQQWVEILKALHGGAKLLILDEPTAVLTPQETGKLFANLRRMRDDGLSIIFITHKLHEVMAVSDRVIVLRLGKLVNAIETDATTREQLARIMVGREVVFRVDNRRMEPGEVLLEVKGVHAVNDKGREALHGVGLTLRRGEILGLAGVSGNGQRELFDVLVGVRPTAAGEILLEGRNLANRSSTYVAEQGLCGVPEDRVRQGLVMDFRVDENLILGRHRDSRFSRGWLLRRREIDAFARRMIDDYEIATPTAGQVVRVLSGGNLQKVVMARELAREPKCLIVSQPTRGLDVGATEYVRRRLLEERDRGAGILLISEDLDEILNLATRIAVMFKGQIVGVLDAEEATVEAIGLLMAGVHHGAAGRLQ